MVILKSMGECNTVEPLQYCSHIIHDIDLLMIIFHSLHTPLESKVVRK